MLPTITSLVIMLVEILSFRNVEANDTVTIQAYCIVEEPYPPKPVFKHVKEHIENCEKLGYVQQPEVKAIKDGIYYAFTLERPQDFSAVDIPKENKCMDYEDEKDNKLKKLLKNYQNAKKKMTESEKEFQQQKLREESVQSQLTLSLTAMLSAYDEGKKLSGSKEGGNKAIINEFESNHKSLYDPLFEKEKPFKEKKRWCAIAKNALDAYIKTMEEEKDLVEYRKYYDANGMDEQFGKLLKTYTETREEKKRRLKDYIQIIQEPEQARAMDLENQALTNEEESCAIAKNALDAYIKTMEEEKDLVGYRKYYDANGMDEQFGKLLKTYTETREEKKRRLKNCIQIIQEPEEPERANMMYFANKALTNEEESCAIAKNVLDAYIKTMEEEKDLVEYRKYYDANGMDEQFGKLLKTYTETREEKKRRLNDYIKMIQEPEEPERANMMYFAKMALTNEEKLVCHSKNALDAYIKTMEEEKEKHKHFESVRTEERKNGEEWKQKIGKKMTVALETIRRKWSDSPKRGRGKIAKEGKEKEEKI